MRLRDLPARLRRARHELRGWRDTAAREAALAQLELVGSVFPEEPDVFTKRQFIIEIADDHQLGRSLLELVERA